jgi:hypothetical protein
MTNSDGCLSPYLSLKHILSCDVYRNKQHHALKLALGGLYPCSELVNVILDPSVNPQPKILDLGMFILVISWAVGFTRSCRMWKWNLVSSVRLA